MSDNADMGSAPSMPGGFEWIGNTIYQAVMSQAQMAQMRQDGQAHPCGMAAYLREILVGAEGLEILDNKWEAVREKAQFLPLAIGDSLRVLGTAPDGGMRLSDFAISTLGADRLIPGAYRAGLALAGGLFPPAILAIEAQWVEDRLPTGLSIENGSYRQNMTNVGERVSSGIYVWGEQPTTPGTYRGSEISGMIAAWIRYQAENVSTPMLGNAREDLTRMVGTWQGTGQYGLWQESDGARSGSELALAIFQVGEMVRLEEESRLLCNQIHIAGQRRADALVGSEVSTSLQDAQTRADQAAATTARNKTITWAAVGLGAFAAYRFRK